MASHDTQFKASPDASSLIKVGELKKPYGIKGWLWVFSHLENRAEIFSHTPWWIKTATGYQVLEVTDWRQQGSGLVASFKQVPDRNVAETMQGVGIWVQRELVGGTDADEYLWSELEGLTVVNTHGECLGVIVSLFETGAHDIMVVEPTDLNDEAQQRLIPWHKQTVVDLSLEKGEVLVDWGLDY